jgi:hypothetical protein
MTDKIDKVIAAMAAHIAHERGWSLPEATAWVRQHMIEAREEYRAAGAPLGDTEQGFLAWMLPRPQPPTA